jgi:hypothetical protein
MSPGHRWHISSRRIERICPAQAESVLPGEGSHQNATCPIDARSCRDSRWLDESRLGGILLLTRGVACVRQVDRLVSHFKDKFFQKKFFL